MRLLGLAVIGAVLAGIALLAWIKSNAASISPFSTVYRFRLDDSFIFDGEPYTATGFMECTYRRAWFTSGSDSYRLGSPIYKGYYTDSWRDAPSVALPDGKGAILFPHGGSCPPLPDVRTIYAAHPTYSGGAVYPAYYFPDQTDPKVIWILRDHRSSRSPASGRLIIQRHTYVTVQERVSSSVAKTVPVAWRWYEQQSQKYRDAMRGQGAFQQRKEDVWRGIYGCVMDEDEWRDRPDFVAAANAVTATGIVTLKQPGRDGVRNCSGQNTPQIALIPSDDYSRATLDLDSDDLRWAAIATPYVSEYRDRSTGRWLPELCVAGEGCTGIRAKTPYWIYLPVRRAFVRLEESWIEPYRFSQFALRYGDGL